MLLTNKMDTKELVVTELINGAVDSLLLQERIKEVNAISKQGFYKAIRELIADEVITKNKQKIFLSPIWLSKLQDFIEKTHQTSNKKIATEMINLKQGDMLVFNLKSITDTFFLWNHYFFTLCKKTKGPIVFFNSHNFWTLIRTDIQNTMYKWIQESEKEAFLLIGYNTPLDKESSNYIRDYNIRVSYENTPKLKENVYPAVFGSYIISTILDKKTVIDIHNVFVKHKNNNQEVKKELEFIINNIKSMKIIIEKNTQKAEKIRKKILNHFIFVN